MSAGKRWSCSRGSGSGWWWSSGGRSARGARPERRFIGCLAVVAIVLFTAVSAYAATAQRHFHWGMPGYLLLFVPLGATVHEAIAQGRRFYRWGLGATVVVSLLFMTVDRRPRRRGLAQGGTRLAGQRVGRGPGPDARMR